MPDVLTIPPAIWRRLQLFLREGKTGAVVLHVHRGAVTAAKLEETVRADEEPVRLAAEGGRG